MNRHLTVTPPRRSAESLNIMRDLVPVASVMTSFVSSCIAMIFANRLLDVLPVGKAYFSDTPLHGLTYGEFFATLIIIFSFAYGIGLSHGFLCGERYLRMIPIIAAIPLFIMTLALAAVTLGMGLIALPIVLAYGAIVAYGAKQGGRLRCRHHGSEIE